MSARRGPRLVNLKELVVKHRDILEEDDGNPKKAYNIDAHKVSRGKWRAHMEKRLFVLQSALKEEEFLHGIQPQNESA